MTAATLNIVDLPIAEQPTAPFVEQVRGLGLSSGLEQKCLAAHAIFDTADIGGRELYLTKEDEGELGTEVLLQRHAFTQQVARHPIFRQAALSVIQNIYLTRERKIFFERTASNTEAERQEALCLFTQPLENVSIPLGKTFQHLILARVWHRIVYMTDRATGATPDFLALEEIVQRLNTLRNIYILLTRGLVNKITANINSTYKQSITQEDARQIGTFGISRAAYRYHPASGMRFSTYASFWILRELQRQALDSRLIRFPATLLETLSKAHRAGDAKGEQEAVNQLNNASVVLEDSTIANSQEAARGPEAHVEQKQTAEILLEAVDTVLTAKSSDIIKRRYGLGLYQGKAQSVLEISQAYNVTRSSVYQLQEKALSRLKKHMDCTFQSGG